MRKKVAGRLLSVLMVAAMTAGTLTGCGGSEGSAGDGADGAQADASGASGETADGVEEFTIATVRWTDAWPNEFMNEGIMRAVSETQ